ncbi:MAG TPA: hypothetical protein PKM59_03765 [Thermodesulfobacteriota bacterium]|nr:hypothetical protein [Thermodesulfobacteriota bacterium]
MAVKLAGERQVEVDGMKFNIGPGGYIDNLKARQQLTDAGITDEKLISNTLVLVMIKNRITSWEGIEAPCTEENKENIFGNNGDLLARIALKYFSEKEAESKNSETSQGGQSEAQANE